MAEESDTKQKCKEEALTLMVDSNGNHRLESQEYRDFMILGLRMEATKWLEQKSGVPTQSLITWHSNAKNIEPFHSGFVATHSDYFLSAEPLKPEDAQAIATIAQEMRQKVTLAKEHPDGTRDTVLQAKLYAQTAPRAIAFGLRSVHCPSQ